MEKFKVTFKPDNKTVVVEKDRTILSAAISAGLNLNSPCGGDGVCGRCKVKIIKGKVVSQPTGLISESDRNKGIHLACGTSVLSDVEVELLPESRLDSMKISQAEEVEFQESQAKDFKRKPLTRKIFLDLPRLLWRSRRLPLRRSGRSRACGFLLLRIAAIHDHARAEVAGVKLRLRLFECEHLPVELPAQDA